MRVKARRISPFRLYGIIAFALAIAVAVILYKWLSLGQIVCWLISINLVSFLFFGFDKTAATSKWLRIPEDVLFSLVLLGGCVGGLGGMVLFRHKVSKSSFQRVFWTIVAMEIAGVCLWYFVIR